MSNSSFKVPYPKNEEILNYSPGSSEKKSVLKKYKELYNGSVEIPLWINGENIKTGEIQTIKFKKAEILVRNGEWIII